jgi:outer membrane protein TolC
MHYTVPRELFEDLVKNVGKESAEKFVNAIERFLEAIQKESQREISEKKETLKAELYNELRSELATKEFVRAEINEVRAEISEVRAEINEVRSEIKQNNLLLKVLIGISIFALTIFNPNFVTLIEKIVK